MGSETSEMRNYYDLAIYDAEEQEVRSAFGADTRNLAEVAEIALSRRDEYEAAEPDGLFMVVLRRNEGASGGPSDG